MERIRIGNNIAISWAVYDLNGRIHNLEGKDIQLYMAVGGYKVYVNSYTIQGNVISWVFLGSEQNKTGDYKLVIEETDPLSGTSAFDVRAAFRLTPEDVVGPDIVLGPANVSVQSVLTYSNLVGIESIDVVESSEDSGNNIVTLHLIDGSFAEVVIKNGSKGPKGDKGDTGATGPKGEKGDTGERGPVGVDTVNAAIGTNDPSQAPSVDKTFAGGVLGLTFNNIKGAKGDKGDQGNTGSSVDYPYELVNNVTTDDATKGLSAAQGVVLDGKIGQLDRLLQKKINPGYYFEFRKRFIANGYYSPVNDYSCTSILEGDGSEYVFPSTSGHCTYKVFQYISDSEGIEITSGWENSELRFNITGKFVVTFNGTFTEQDKSVYEWLVANWRLGKYDVALEPRMEFLENSSVIDMMNQGAALIGKTKNKEIYIPFPEFYTKNLLNLEDADVMLGYRQYSDTPQQNNSYNLSGYIPVTPGVTYCYSTSNTTYAEIQYHAVFDKNRNFIRGGADAITTFTAQPGDAFVRITLRAAAWGDDNQFEVGTTPTEYKPFGVNFKFLDSERPEIVMPQIVYTTKGVENSIYHKNYCNFLTDNFIIASYRNYEAAAWKYLSRCFRTTNGNQTIEMRLYQKSPFKFLKGLSVQSVVGDPATDNGNIKVICIGDSFTYDGRYLQQIADICPNINLVGMRKPAQNIQSDSIRCEGRGGWTLADYKLPYGDLTPSHMQPFSPFVQADGYNYYGATPFWAAIVNGTSQYGYGTNGFDDYKSWFGADGYKLNPSVNDLMYDGTSFKYWDGTSWTALSTAPTFTFDFAKYISIWQIPAPNMVFIFLGKNDFHSGVADWDTFKANLDSLIASIHSYNSNIIIGVCTPTTADEAKNNSDNANSFLGHMNMWNARKLMVENYDNLSTSRVFIVDTGTTLDPDYGFVLEERPPFAFYEGNEKELFAINGVHPSGAGYKQIGTCIAGFIQAKR